MTTLAVEPANYSQFLLHAAILDLHINEQER